MEYQNENFNGEYDFRSRFHDGWQVKAHLHEYSELLYCQNGSGTVTVNGQSICLEEKSLIWIPPNYVHQYDLASAKVVCAVFSNDLIPLFFRALNGRYFYVSAVKAEELAVILEKLYLLKKEDYLTVSGYLNLICAKVISQSAFGSMRRNDGILYQKVISYISENYTENITLSGVAQKFGYNEKYLSHSLHDLTGIHFKQLLAFYRVNHAKRLLESRKEINITTVSAESGFSSLNTFHRVFKTVTGMTPSEYRQTFSI